MQQITAIIRKFWWAGVQEDNPTTPISYRSWDDICQSKENGGLGIRDLETVNKSLIIHAAYNIADNKNPFLTAVLKAKYFPNSFFGQHTILVFDLSFGHLSCRSRHIFITMLPYNCMLVTLLFGQHLGVLFGKIFMIICFFLLLSHLCLPQSPNYGTLILTLGILITSQLYLIIMLCRQ
jgi:hypothetical protein